MKVELKNYKEIRSLGSFSAVILVDGRECMTVANRGRGGDNEYRPLGATRESFDLMDRTLAALRAHVATLPPLITEYGEFSMSVDLLIEDVQNDHLLACKLRRDMRKAVLLSRGSKLIAVKCPGGVDASSIARVRGLYPEARVLNDLPMDEILAVCKAGGPA